MMAGEKKQKRIDQIDGRTVLFLTLCACIVTFLTTSFLGHGCFSFLIFLILCWFGLYKQALGCFAVYLVAIVWLMIETKYQISIPSPLLLSMIYKLLLPAMPAYLLAKIPSGKLTACLRKMPIPTRIMLVLIVMLRFAPTVLHEFGEVREAMKIRGFLKSVGNVLKKRPFYMCRHSTADVNSRCRDVRADVAGLEEAVLLTLKKQLEILLPVHKDGTIHLEATAAKCSEYEKQLEVLKDQKQALFERYLLGQIELDTYKSEKAVYDAEILKVKNAYAAVTAQAKLKREEQARQSSRQEIVHSIAEADVLTSELTDLLIEKVYVFPDNRIEIIYKVHDLFE